MGCWVCFAELFGGVMLARGQSRPIEAQLLAHLQTRLGRGRPRPPPISFDWVPGATAAPASPCPPETSNKTFDLYAYTRGLDGVNQNANWLFVNILVACFFSLCFIFLLLRFTKMGNAQMRHIITAGSKDNQTFWSINRTWWRPWLKRHLEYAPLGRARHNREIQLTSQLTMGTLPSRNIAYMLVLPWHEKQSQSVVAALRGRSGILAAINLIPTILFALRNNPFIWILHVSYDTFNLFHRWCARMVILESIIHTCCWFSNAYSAGKWAAIHEALTEVDSYKWGMVGASLFTVMGIQAWSPLRHAFYETFLNAHRLLALFAFIGVYVHLDTHTLPQLPWIQIVFILWGLEWLARSTWLAYYNVSRRQFTRVTVEAMPSEASRVTLQLARPWKPRPGAHVHIYIPFVSLWSSHPFSIAWADIKAPELKANSPNLDLENEGDLKLNLEASNAKAHSISLVCRAREGMTRKLYKRASAQPSRTFTTIALIEGPYAGHDSLSSYGTVLLFAGGVGITHQVSHVRHLVSGYAAGTVAARKVVLIWTVPNTESLEWVRPWMDEILQMPRRRDVLKIKLFITKPRSHAEVASETGTVQMYPGRCNAQTVLDAELKERIGAMAVTVCGPGAFADSVRDAARKRVEVGVLDFIEEAFTY
ncbi:putative FRE ferric reductase-like transmembrane component [Rhizodiscina lignyota]|uniref:FRE ferric reductase-like transmembrane component n=1 Tax=Rhizodiscina lignyota TaxID=1504668 RepID=A0A9P4IQ99_9PEZI|nr:putative FRE ferric reductase-like transmembrane component [Rhizodiscina lignyota]